MADRPEREGGPKLQTQMEAVNVAWTGKLYFTKLNT